MRTRGIITGDRSKESTGACLNTRGVHKQPAECDIVTRCATKGSQKARFVIPLLHDIHC